MTEKLLRPGMLIARTVRIERMFRIPSLNYSSPFLTCQPEEGKTIFPHYGKETLLFLPALYSSIVACSGISLVLEAHMLLS